MTVAAIAIVLFDMGVIFTKVGTGITVVEIIPTILIVSVIILQQQGEHIIYPIITTATREEDEHIIANP